MQREKKGGGGEEWNESERRSAEAGKTRAVVGSRCEGPNERGFRRAGTRFEKVAALSLPEGASLLAIPGFGDGPTKERARQRNGLRDKEHPAPDSESGRKGKRLLRL